jgi:Domain of unknown function (DUF4386)
MKSRDRDARVAGLLYLLFSITGAFDLMYVSSKVVKPGDAGATMRNIMAHESLYRIWMVSEMVAIILGLAVTFALYRLFKDVDRTQAIILVIVGGILPVPLYFVNAVFSAGALIAAHGGGFLAAFTEPQRAGLAMLFLRLHHYDLMTSFIFAGLWLFPFGILVYKSGFLPRILGIWLVVNGFPYLAYTFVDFLTPQYYDTLTNVTFPLLFGEIAIMLWLLIMGARPGFVRRPPAAEAA